MRDKVSDRTRLEHIRKAILDARASQSRYTYDDLVADPITLYGFVKLVEIVGEAAYMLTKEFRAAHPQVDWRMIERMRHVLVHGYYAIEPMVLWSVVENDLDELLPHIEAFLAEP